MKNKNAVSAKVARILRKTVKHILAVPARYDQNEVLTKVTPGQHFGYSGLRGNFKAPECGTIGCLAGWITFLDLGPKKAMRGEVDAVTYAAKKLKLLPEERESLFGGYHSWPEKFVDAYENAKTPRQVAKVAQRRVEHFIKTGE